MVLAGKVGPVDPKNETKVVHYVIKHIIPAAPGTFALFKMKDGLFRKPVPAWGVWDAVTDVVNGSRTIKKAVEVEPGAGPLVVDCGSLYPAADEDDYVGVRIGDYVELGSGNYYDDDDDSKKSIEPFPKDYK